MGKHKNIIKVVDYLNDPTCDTADNEPDEQRGEHCDGRVPHVRHLVELANPTVHNRKFQISNINSYLISLYPLIITHCKKGI